MWDRETESESKVFASAIFVRKSRKARGTIRCPPDNQIVEKSIDSLSQSEESRRHVIFRGEKEGPNEISHSVGTWNTVGKHDEKSQAEPVDWPDAI